ncbi:MAG TPA: hypothetical protein VFX37_02780 [Pseudolabrys sp.]|nr:hypothetical protein [Pseudolabrys sp.]
MRGCALACFFVIAVVTGPGTALAQGAGEPASVPSSAGTGGEDNSEFWSKVALDPAVPDTPAKPLAASPSLLASKPLDVTRSDNPDGTGSISINKSLATPWDAKIGSSLGYSDTSSSDFDPTRPLPATKNADQSRAVWADVAVPEVGSINTRVDTGSDQGKYGTSIARSMPLGSHLSFTAQDSYSITESYGTSAVTSAIPLAAIPANSSAAAPSQIWANERKVNLNVLSTGTTFGAGWTTATGDPVTHNTFSADQKLYGSLHVTTSVSDAGRPTASKSITAGFKMSW